MPPSKQPYNLVFLQHKSATTACDNGLNKVSNFKAVFPLARVETKTGYKLSFLRGIPTNLVNEQISLEQSAFLSIQLIKG